MSAKEKFPPFADTLAGMPATVAVQEGLGGGTGEGTGVGGVVPGGAGSLLSLHATITHSNANGTRYLRIDRIMAFPFPDFRSRTLTSRFRSAF